MDSKDYQSLLILEKELELSILDQQAAIQKLKRIVGNISEPSNKIKDKAAELGLTLKKKKEYSINYYRQVSDNLAKAAESRMLEIEALEGRLDR